MTGILHDPCGDHLPLVTRVADRSWVLGSTRYEITTWCQENLGPASSRRWEIHAEPDSSIIIRTADPGDHALATMVWG